MIICFDARVIINEKTGIGNYSFNLLRSLLEIDNKNLYVALINNNLNSNHQIFKLRNENLIKEVVTIPPVSIRQQFSIPIQLMKIKPDIYHYPNWDVPIFHPYKTIVTMHDLTYLLYDRLYVKHYQAKKFYTKMNMFLGLKKATKIIAVSENTKKDIQNFFKIDPNKIETIYESCDADFENLELDRYRGSFQDALKINKRYFLVVAERRPHKNLLRIFEAFKIFKGQFPDFKLVVVGKSYSNYNEPEKLVNRLNLENDILFLGYVSTETLIKLYVNSEAFLFLSIYEGFGIPLLEAMSCETPIITSNISAMPEIAQSAAILVDPFDVSEIAKAMIKIANDRDLGLQLRKKGKERVKFFSWKNSAQLTLKLYERLSHSSN